MTALTHHRLLLLVVFGASILSLRGSDFDTIGVTPLRAVDATLIGTGIYVNHVEASLSGTTNFEVGPATTGQPTSLFTWIGLNGSATTFPNSVGTESSHADSVADHFYHVNDGPSPGVSHVDNYLADVYYENIIVNGTATSAKVVNQSFVFGGTPPDSTVDAAYDNYAARYGTIFGCVAGSGAGSVLAPGSAYNVVTSGVSDGPTSTGGAPDGRAKPDLCCPGQLPSFSVPYVSASAAVLLQAAARGDGGANVFAASDLRTVKALLMNGSVKPSNWTHTAAVPLDVTHGYGAGVLNLFNSWKQMTGAQHRPIETTTVTTGAAHPPGSNPANETSLVGWDFGTISTSGQDTIAHYYFSVPATNGSYTLTATLIWDRSLNASSINDLDFFLYRTSTGAQVAVSSSAIDNVEHIYVPSLPPGRYDLQVLKNSGAKSITASETYALAFETFVIGMTITKQANTVVISWPLYPNGFTLESAPSLSPPITWNPVTNTPVISNNLYQITVNSLGSMSYYRLRR
jgi:hypothetical protein